MKSSEIRQAFLDYFTARGHQMVPSASLVPHHDPSLLFTNAGMVPFKETFLGLETRPYTRAVSVQRCVRAGGKHNDLENVGYTVRHHTFFEMLGNFSFGDYFKREAIVYAWEFLTKVLQLPEEKLWVTVHLDDDEAADIWLKELGISSERFSRCDADNFWSMGDTGPCGPCTEIFYDHGPDIPGGPPGSPEADGDRYIEIWNLVFMQFNRDKEGRLNPLPKRSVDTGMGLERIAAVVQGVHSNYEIDSFRHLIQSIISLAPKIDHQSPSLKVIVDHIRACSFLIADGIMPSNEGRGYVLRRIIRRAIRHGNKLGLPTPFFYNLVSPLVTVMGDAYPELSASKETIARVLMQEENQFAKTLEQGLRLLQEQISTLKGDTIGGDICFKLYDTYGFPLDLTEDIAREQGLLVDREGFNQFMQQQRVLSQSASQFDTDYSTTGLLMESSCFHGYDTDSLTTKVSAILLQDKKVDVLAAGQKAAVILQDSPFYAESGGQVGDRGQLLAKDLLFKVEDTKKINQAIVHYGELLQGELRQNQEVKAEIDSERRMAIRLNHTATHLLHRALQLIIGSHVLQKGSLVDAERARFDFSHFEPLNAEELSQLEILVNQRIRLNEAVLTHHMNLEEAKKSGAQALFGEKYSEEVRVLAIGDFSKELCGGTHVRRTGDIGLFKIVSEYGIASGIRRIEFVTGFYALQYIREQLSLLDITAEKLKTNPSLVPEKVGQILQELKQQEKALARNRQQMAQQSGADYLKDVEQLDSGVQFLIKQLENGDSQILRTTLDQLKSKLQTAVIILYTLEQDKINVIAGVSKGLLGKVPSAAILVKQLCGRGGGREDMAQGGGTVPAELDKKINEIRAML